MRNSHSFPFRRDGGSVEKPGDRGGILCRRINAIMRMKEVNSERTASESALPFADTLLARPFMKRSTTEFRRVPP